MASNIHNTARITYYIIIQYIYYINAQIKEINGEFSGNTLRYHKTKRCMNYISDVIARLVNLGIVRIDNDRVYFTYRYIQHLSSIYSELKSAYDSKCSLFIDSNAYALTAWIGNISECELVELLSVIMSIWGELLHGESSY